MSTLVSSIMTISFLFQSFLERHYVHFVLYYPCDIALVTRDPDYLWCNTKTIVKGIKDDCVVNERVEIIKFENRGDADVGRSELLLIDKLSDEQREIHFNLHQSIIRSEVSNALLVLWLWGSDEAEGISKYINFKQRSFYFLSLLQVSRNHFLEFRLK